MINVFIFLGYVLHITKGYTGFTGPNRDKIVACYYASWAAYRAVPGRFDVSDIEPSLCSHLIYSFVGLDENSFKIAHIDAWQDLEDGGGLGAIKRFTALKEKHKHLKTTVALGGWNEGSSKYSKMAADPKLRKIFIKSVITFLTTHNLDGLDLFWEYPTKRGGKFADRKNYVTLVKELSETFQAKNFILTGSLRCGSEEMDSIYDLSQIYLYLDFMHIMAYDYHGSWNDVIGANAPLFGLNEGDTSSVNYTISHLMEHGMPAYKIILDIATYGRTFYLIKTGEKNISFGETITESKGFKGPFTDDEGFMGYNEICLEMLNQSSQWVSEWNDLTNTPYIRDNKRVVTYDNTRSIANKVKYAMDVGLGGFAAWSITTDDFSGACDEENDTYKDYIDRFNGVAREPLLIEALITLQEEGYKNKHYILNEKHEVTLKLPNATFANFPLLRTLHDATNLALEEGQVLYEMQKLSDARRNEIEKDNFPCIRTCTEVCYFGLREPDLSRNKRYIEPLKSKKYIPPR